MADAAPSSRTGGTAGVIFGASCPRRAAAEDMDASTITSLVKISNELSTYLGIQNYEGQKSKAVPKVAPVTINYTMSASIC